MTWAQMLGAPNNYRLGFDWGFGLSQVQITEDQTPLQNSNISASKLYLHGSTQVNREAVIDAGLSLATGQGFNFFDFTQHFMFMVNNSGSSSSTWFGAGLVGIFMEAPPGQTYSFNKVFGGQLVGLQKMGRFTFYFEGGPVVNTQTAKLTNLFFRGGMAFRLNSNENKPILLKLEADYLHFYSLASGYTDHYYEETLGLQFGSF